MKPIEKYYDEIVHTAMLSLTIHAQARLQQRGIPQEVIEMLLDFGRENYDRRGGRVMYFDHHLRKQLVRHLGAKAYKRMESHLSAYAVISLDGSILTVGHRTKHITRH
jgi:hypothetical protein